MADFNIHGNPEKEIEIRYTTWLYKVELNLKHGQIVFKRRRKPPKKAEDI